jgi:hypothetical protein
MYQSKKKTFFELDELMETLKQQTWAFKLPVDEVSEAGKHTSNYCQSAREFAANIGLSWFVSGNNRIDGGFSPPHFG